jgi:hypothetical protein
MPRRSIRPYPNQVQPPTFLVLEYEYEKEHTARDEQKGVMARSLNAETAGMYGAYPWAEPDLVGGIR